MASCPPLPKYSSGLTADSNKIVTNLPASGSILSRTGERAPHSYAGQKANRPGPLGDLGASARPPEVQSTHSVFDRETARGSPSVLHGIPPHLPLFWPFPLLFPNCLAPLIFRGPNLIRPQLFLGPQGCIVLIVRERGTGYWWRQALIKILALEGVLEGVHEDFTIIPRPMCNWRIE